MYLNIGHRGAKGHYRENCIRSIKIAKELKCNIIEIDVRRSNDGIFFMCHDEKVKFLNPETISVYESRIEDEDYQKISNAGLDQMLFGIMHITEKSHAYLDLKIGSIEKNNIEYIKKYGDDLMIALEDFEDGNKQIFIGSLNKILMKYLSEKYFDKNFLYGLIYDEHEEIKSKDVNNKKYHFYVINHTSNNLQDIPKLIQKNNKYLFLYTLNSFTEMKNAHNNIVFNGIVSDYPDKVTLFCKSLR
jgi:glycerophosphoryl diester phosphodiesterase